MKRTHSFMDSWWDKKAKDMDPEQPKEQRIKRKEYQWILDNPVYPVVYASTTTGSKSLNDLNYFFSMFEQEVFDEQEKKKKEFDDLWV